MHVDTLAGRIIIRGKVNHLDLQTHGGDIEIDDAELLRAVTMGGSVTVNHRLGDSFIRTGGGDIRVDASVGDLAISSLGGNIWLKAIAKGRVESGGGNIEVVRCMGSLLVRTAGGNINLGEMGGAVTAETGGGNIRIGVAHGPVVASTALGDIALWKLAQGADAHTGMGRITAEFIGDRKLDEGFRAGDLDGRYCGVLRGNGSGQSPCRGREKPNAAHCERLSGLEDFQWHRRRRDRAAWSPMEPFTAADLRSKCEPWSARSNCVTSGKSI